MRSKLILLAKIGVSLALMIYLFYKTDINMIWESMRSARISWLFLALGLNALGYGISSLRWKILLEAQGIRIPLVELIKSYLVGTFFNNFLPTTMGGDMVRAYDTSRASQSLTRSITIILVERLTGFFALLMYGLLGLSLGPSLASQRPAVFLIGGLLLALIIGLMVGSRYPGKPFETASSGWGRIRDKLSLFSQTLYFYKDKKGDLLKALMLAFLLQFNVILFFYLIASALNLGLSFYHLLIIMPLIHIILMIPISINGIGLRENAYIFFFAQVGVASAASVALSWVAFAAVLVFGLVGGIFYATR